MILRVGMPNKAIARVAMGSPHIIHSMHSTGLMQFANITSYLSPAASCKDGLYTTNRLPVFPYQKGCVAEFRHVGQKLEVVGQTSSVLKPERERGGEGEGEDELITTSQYTATLQDISLIRTL